MDYIVYGATATTSQNEPTDHKRGRRRLLSFPKSRLPFDSNGCLCATSGDLTSSDFRNENCVLLLKNGKPITVTLVKDGITFEYALKLFAPRPVEDDDSEPKIIIGFHVATFYAERKDEKEADIEIRRTDAFQAGARIATFQKALRAAFLDLGLERPAEFATVNIMYCADPLWQRLVEKTRLEREEERKK